jgi:putative transposase
MEVPGATYHVTARGNAGMRIFGDDFDRVHLLGLMGKASDTFGWSCLAYCLMDNHYHLLVRILGPNLSSGMRLIQTGYAKRFNARHGRQGHVFGDRFHNRRVDGDEHLLSAVVYTVLNPVRARVVDAPQEWRWSSYRATAGLEEPPGMLDLECLLGLLSPQRERAQAMYREMVAEAVCGIRGGRRQAGDSHLR